MFLTVHSTAGVVIGSYFTNPVEAFILGIISHFIFDMIPHGDENFKDTTIKGMAKKAAWDHFFLVLNFFIIWQVWSINLLQPSIICGVVGSMLPDWLMGVHRLTAHSKKTLWKNIHAIIQYSENIHNYCHYQIIKYESPVTVGLATQLLCLLSLWMIL